MAAVTLIVFLGFLSNQTKVLTMWWRGTTLVLSSSTLLSTLLSAVVHAPGSYGAYVDPAVLDACPGYVTRKVSQTRGGSEIRIELGLPDNSPGCAVFGKDIQNLVLVATYETRMLNSCLFLAVF